MTDCQQIVKENLLKEYMIFSVTRYFISIRLTSIFHMCSKKSKIADSNFSFNKLDIHIKNNI